MTTSCGTSCLISGAGAKWGPLSSLACLLCISAQLPRVTAGPPPQRLSPVLLWSLASQARRSLMIISARVYDALAAALSAPVLCQLLDTDTHRPFAHHLLGILTSWLHWQPRAIRLLDLLTCMAHHPEVSLTMREWADERVLGFVIQRFYDHEILPLCNFRLGMFRHFPL